MRIGLHIKASRIEPQLGGSILDAFYTLGRKFFFAYFEKFITT
ncbi:hypothetical protein BCA_2972 [Bacillus cereus 03BB102]|uniref:Uncharacterized protein n=1 Tax=Bacillus cereus (strain 03BB102) TaxID=572264 RepID=A0A158RMT0_BACC3|nr:hypothetical protein BCA_2972 [Bacillus cereus 03BB102]EDX65740.1 hypothetical protein BC059799_2847 [Bacillus cereus NVH0597-99]